MEERPLHPRINKGKRMQNMTEEERKIDEEKWNNLLKEKAEVFGEEEGEEEIVRFAELNYFLIKAA